MPKMSRGVFEKWVQEHRERLVLQLQLEQAPGEKLIELAEERGHEITPKDTRQKLVRIVVGDLYVDIPEGYSRRKVIRALGISSVLHSRAGMNVCVPLV